MKIRIRAAVAAVTCVLATCSGPYLASAQTRIMPLGDSITEAETGHASYRYWLWNVLTDAGHEVDFVGTMVGVRGGPPLYGDFDQDHEGHWGIRADQVLVQIATWAVATEPDVVLIHLGHNDLWQGQDVASTIDDLEGIVAGLRSVNPLVAVFLAQVIPSADPRISGTPTLNAGIAQLARSLDTHVSRVIAVDHATGFDPTSDTYDGTHPNQAGEQKMSNTWFAVLDSIMNPMPLLPEPRSPRRRVAPDGPNAGTNHARVSRPGESKTTPGRRDIL